MLADTRKLTACNSNVSSFKNGLHPRTRYNIFKRVGRVHFFSNVNVFMYPLSAFLIFNEVIPQDNCFAEFFEKLPFFF